jgi:hypothetical protein
VDFLYDPCRLPGHNTVLLGPLLSSGIVIGAVLFMPRVPKLGAWLSGECDCGRNGFLNYDSTMKRLESQYCYGVFFLEPRTGVEILANLNKQFS